MERVPSMLVLQEALLLRTGVWLLVRCADLQGLGFDVTDFWFCLGMLFAIGAGFRIAACACMLFRR